MLIIVCRCCNLRHTFWSRSVAQWVARLTRDRWIPVSSSHIKTPRCFIEHETLLSLLSTGWFQERIRT